MAAEWSVGGGWGRGEEVGERLKFRKRGGNSFCRSVERKEWEEEAGGKKMARRGTFEKERGGGGGPNS